MLKKGNIFKFSFLLSISFLCFFYVSNYVLYGEEQSSKSSGFNKCITGKDIYASIVFEENNEGNVTGYKYDNPNVSSDYYDPSIKCKNILLQIDKKEVLSFYSLTKPTQLNVSPYMDKGITMVPLRFVTESFGAEIKWNSKNKQIIIIDNDKTITLKIDQRIATVNNEEIELSSSPVLKNGITMIPLRFVSENLGANVSWYADFKGIEIVRQLK